MSKKGCPKLYEQPFKNVDYKLAISYELSVVDQWLIAKRKYDSPEFYQMIVSLYSYSERSVAFFTEQMERNKMRVP